jgi:Helix-turn-helix domain
MATVLQAYRFALDPTPRQRRALASHCGAARVAHNWGLKLVKHRLEQRQANPRKLARRLEHGTARMLAATVTRTADRWYVSFTVEVRRALPLLATAGRAWWGWMLASGIWRCCPPEPRFPIPMPFSAPSASCGG